MMASGPSVPRPGGRPLHISAECPGCGTPLVPTDSLREDVLPEELRWHDHWSCPECRDGVIMDWPAGDILDHADGVTETGDPDGDLAPGPSSALQAGPSEGMSKT